MFGAVTLSNAIIRQAGQGSRDALDHLLAAVQPQIRLMVAARLSPTAAQLEAVEDITQRVLLAVAQGIARLRNQTVDGFKSYTSTIAARKVADFIRRIDRDKAGPGVISLDATVGTDSAADPLWQFLSLSGTSPRTTVQRAEQAARVMSELGLMKPSYREILTLAFFDQLPVWEIGRRLAISRPAASMLLIRAVQDLRRRMAAALREENLHGF